VVSQAGSVWVLHMVVGECKEVGKEWHWFEWFEVFWRFVMVAGQLAPRAWRVGIGGQRFIGISVKGC